MLVSEISAGQDDRPKWFAAGQASISAGHMAGDRPLPCFILSDGISLTPRSLKANQGISYYLME